MKHYLYRHIRLDKNEPFYIGVGTQTRGLYARSKIHTCRNRIWNYIVKKTAYKVEILFESNDYNLIKNKEIEFIKLYGKIVDKTGTLSNLTDGGDGILGLKHSDKTKEILRLKNIGKKLSEEHKMKIGKAGLFRKIVFTKEHKGKISESRKSSSFIFPENCKKSWFKDGQSSFKSQKVKNIDTEEIFDSITKAAESQNINRRTLNKKLNGVLRNNTNLIKLQNE